MKIERGYPTYTVTPKAENAIVKGHPWVYDAEILNIEGETANGGLVDVISKKGRYLGTGFLSQQSKIRVRLISRNANDRFDEAFWRRKLQWAWDYRKSVMDPADLDACRVIFGEADAFPGLTVDKFHDLLSVQVLSVGMENLQDLLLPALVDILRQDGQPIRGVFRAQRRGSPGKGRSCRRARAGMPYPAKHPRTVRWWKSWKTGVELPGGRGKRPENRLFPGPEVQPPGGGPAGRRARPGAGLLHPHRLLRPERRPGRRQARDGGGRVRSPPWRWPGKTRRRNGLSDVMDCVAANVFDLLPAAGKGSPGSYDFIILDPPAFTKTRKTVAQRHHRLQGDQLPGHEAAAPGRVLWPPAPAPTSPRRRSSQAMLRSAARDAGVQLRQIEARQQSCRPSHPLGRGRNGLSEVLSIPGRINSVEYCEKDSDTDASESFFSAPKIAPRCPLAPGRCFFNWFLLGAQTEISRIRRSPVPRRRRRCGPATTASPHTPYRHPRRPAAPRGSESCWKTGCTE